MSLSKKLYGIVGTLVLIIVLGTFGALAIQKHIVSGYQSLSAVEYALVDAAAQARYETELSVREMKNFIVRREDKWAEAFRKAVANARKHLDRYAQAATKEEEKKMAEEAKKHLDRHIAGVEASIAAHKKNPKISLEELDKLQAGINRPIAAITLKMQEIALKDYETKSRELQILSDRAGYVLVGGSLGIALIAMFIVIAFVRRLVQSITAAVATAVKVADGDLTVAVNIQSGDEIGLMMSKLKEMVERLRNDVSSLKQASSSISSGSRHLSNQASTMTKTVNDQSLRSTQIATASEEMSQTVIDIARNAADIATSASETASVASQGAKVVEQSVAESRAIAETVTRSTEVVKTLGDRSQQIGEIISVINDIADQTNLLALNAAIEAARAGEQGRGFAVVADEVRKLAERTAKATAEISGMIKGIQHEVGNAVDTMQIANGRVESGLAYSLEAGKQLEAIVSSVSGLQAMVQQIASATEEMSSTSEGIAGDIQEIANGAQNLTGNSQQIATSSSDLSRLSGELQTIVLHFKV